jgi:signal peptidase I
MSEKHIVAFSPEDMKRRRTRSLVLAAILVGFIVLFFVTTIYKIKSGIH